jgi:hypothetical protein
MVRGYRWVWHVLSTLSYCSQNNRDWPVFTWRQREELPQAIASVLRGKQNLGLSFDAALWPRPSKVIIFRALDEGQSGAEVHVGNGLPKIGSLNRSKKRSIEQRLSSVNKSALVVGHASGWDETFCEQACHLGWYKCRISANICKLCSRTLRSVNEFQRTIYTCNWRASLARNFATIGWNADCNCQWAI